MFNIIKVFEELETKIPSGRDVAIYDEEGKKLHLWHLGDHGRFRKILSKEKKADEKLTIRETDILVVVHGDGTMSFDKTDDFEVLKREYKSKE